MKNVFKVAAVAFAALVAVTAKADALYWQVDEGSTTESFQYAILNVTDGTTATRLAGASAEGTAPNQYVSLQNTDISSYASSGYSFFVELANYNNGSWEVVTSGTPVIYDNLVSGGYVATSFQQGLNISRGYNLGAGAAAVPEPTSGLLLLIGGAMLALRRRRQK